MFKCRNIWVLIQLGQLKKGECWQNMNEAENESGFVELREILGVNTFRNLVDLQTWLRHFRILQEV